MNVDAPLEVGAQFTERCQPSVCALDYPAVTPEPVVTLDAPASNVRLNASTPEMGTA